jgi:rod shape-determining protein MreC
LLRQRTRRIFGILLLIALLILVVGLVDTRHVIGNWFKEAFIDLGSWISRPFLLFGQWISNTWNSLTNLSSIAQEVEDLRQENTHLQGEIVLARRALQENESLRQLLALKQTLVPSSVLSAEVIAKDVSPYVQSVIIDVGTSSGVAPLMPVLGPSGSLVGQVIEVFSSKARVLLLTDLNSAVAGRIERTGELAIVKGDGLNSCQVERMVKETQMQAGDLVVTSGNGGIFPAGLLVGTIREVHTSGSLYLRATLEPTIDLTNLQFLLLLPAQITVETLPVIEPIPSSIPTP